MAERWNLNKMDKHIYFRTPPEIQKGQASLQRETCFFGFPYVLYFILMPPYWQANANLALGIGNLRAAASGIINPWKDDRRIFCRSKKPTRSIEGELLFL